MNMALGHTHATSSSTALGIHLPQAPGPQVSRTPLELLLARARETAETTEARWPGHRFGLRMVQRMHDMQRDAERIASDHEIPEAMRPLLQFCLAGAWVGRIQEGALDLDTLRESPSLGELTLEALEGWGVLEQLSPSENSFVREVLGSTNRFEGDLSLSNPSFMVWKAVKDVVRERILADESLVTAEGILQQIEIHFLCRVVSESELLALRKPDGMRPHMVAGIQSILDGTSFDPSPLRALEGNAEAIHIYHRVRSYLFTPVDEKALSTFECFKTPSPVTGKRSFGTFMLQYLSFPFETIRDDAAIAVARSKGFSDRIALLGKIVGAETEIRVISALNRHLSGRGTGCWLSMPV